MRQPIGSRLHGVLDYLTGTSLVAASLLPALRDRYAGRALRLAGAGHLAYSLLTDYELGAVKLLPYRAHLGMDAGGALGLAATSLARRRGLDRWLPAAVGVYELGAVALSDPRREGAGGGGEDRHAVTIGGEPDAVQSFLRDPEAVRSFARSGTWAGEFELRPAPGGRGTEVHARGDRDDLRRAKQLFESGEVVTAENGVHGRRGPLGAALPSLDTGS